MFPLGRGNDKVHTRRQSKQMKTKFIAVALVGMLIGGMLTASIPANGGGLGDSLGTVLKGAGIVLLVDKFSGQLNDFVNKITFNKGVGVEDRTKVVPIISVGKGGFVGAAQVSGPAHLVEKVKAVAQLEGTMSSFRIKALVPVESKDVVKDLKRISGVGVSAIIDVKL